MRGFHGGGGFLPRRHVRNNKNVVYLIKLVTGQWKRFVVSQLVCHKLIGNKHHVVKNIFSEDFLWYLTLNSGSKYKRWTVIERLKLEHLSYKAVYGLMVQALCFHLHWWEAAWSGEYKVYERHQNRWCWCIYKCKDGWSKFSSVSLGLDSVKKSLLWGWGIWDLT